MNQVLLAHSQSALKAPSSSSSKSHVGVGGGGVCVNGGVGNGVGDASQDVIAAPEKTMESSAVLDSDSGAFCGTGSGGVGETGSGTGFAIESPFCRPDVKSESSSFQNNLPFSSDSTLTPNAHVNTVGLLYPYL